MKKVLFIAVVAVASFASCKKDRTCNCTYTNSLTGSASTADVTTYTKARKGDARAACLSYKYVNDNGSTTTADCKLN